MQCNTPRRKYGSTWSSGTKAAEMTRRGLHNYIANHHSDANTRIYFKSLKIINY